MTYTNVPSTTNPLEDRITDRAKRFTSILNEINDTTKSNHDIVLSIKVTCDDSRMHSLMGQLAHILADIEANQDLYPMSDHQLTCVTRTEQHYDNSPW